MPDLKVVSDDTQSKIVQGFEFDQSLANDLTDGTVYILAIVNRQGCAVFEYNHSDGDDIKTGEQLEEIAIYYGYITLFKNEHGNIWYVIDAERFRVKESIHSN